MRQPVDELGSAGDHPHVTLIGISQDAPVAGHDRHVQRAGLRDEKAIREVAVQLTRKESSRKPDLDRKVRTPYPRQHEDTVEPNVGRRQELQGTAWTGGEQAHLPPGHGRYQKLT